MYILIAAGVGLFVGIATGNKFVAPFASHLIRFILAGVGAFLLTAPPSISLPHPIAENIGGGLLTQFAGFYFGPIFKTDEREKPVAQDHRRARANVRNQDRLDPWER